MLISLEHNFIFVHVYRTGGTSIRSALEPYAHQPSRTLVRRALSKLGVDPPASVMPFRYRDFYKHARARELQAELPKNVYDSCFKFAFVRNPWDVQVSMYHYILSNPRHAFYADVSKLADFEAFVEWLVEHYRKLQKEFVVDEQGRQIVDFVGRFENMQADFRSVCEAIGVTAELPHRNGTSHRRYAEYYTPRARRLVEAHYQDDIEFFGYTFEEVAESYA